MDEDKPGNTAETITGVDWRDLVEQLDVYAEVGFETPESTVEADLDVVYGRGAGTKNLEATISQLLDELADPALPRSEYWRKLQVVSERQGRLQRIPQPRPTRNRES